MEISKETFKKNLVKSLILAAFFVIYMVVFLFLFFTKGIFVNDNFYKKSANINTITYTAAKNVTPKKIILKKQFDKSEIVVDGVALSITERGDITYQDGNSAVGIDEKAIKEIAAQKTETHRGSHNKTWFFVVIIYVVFLLLKKYSTQVYSFFNRNKAPGESYYKYFDNGFTIFCIVALAYLMVSI